MRFYKIRISILFLGETDFHKAPLLVDKIYEKGGFVYLFLQSKESFVDYLYFTRVSYILFVRVKRFIDPTFSHGNFGQIRETSEENLDWIGWFKQSRADREMICSEFGGDDLNFYKIKSHKNKSTGSGGGFLLLGRTEISEEYIVRITAELAK